MNQTLPTDRTTGLQTELGYVTEQLDYWSSGQYRADRPHQRLDAGEALDSIDAMLKILHQLRSELVTEIRSYDDQSMRRTDELLRKIRAERGDQDDVLAEFDRNRLRRDQEIGDERRKGNAS